MTEQLMAWATGGETVILYVLAAMSIASLAVAAERAIRIAMARGPKDHHKRVELLAHDGTPALTDALLEDDGAPARVVAAGIAAGRLGGAKAADEAMQGQLLAEQRRLGRGLMVLGTVGSNAPFVGLLGTVLGIMEAFHDLAAAGGEPEVVMSGISQALIATAVGLVVAIPAVVLYNLLSGQVGSLLDAARVRAHLVLVHFEAVASRRAA